MLGLVNRPHDISLSRANQSQAKFESAVGGNFLQSWVNMTIVTMLRDGNIFSVAKLVESKVSVIIISCSIFDKCYKNMLTAMGRFYTVYAPQGLQELPLGKHV